MAVKSDQWIIDTARRSGMIEPFEASNVGRGCISYGVSSYGYDFRLHDRYRRPIASPDTVLDPKQDAGPRFEDASGANLVIAPGSFILGRSLEYFRIPRDVLALCYGKSTYARCGVIVNVTPLEPEWEGFLTVSIVNAGAAPVRIYADEGIAQLIFFEAAEPCLTSYKDRRGKYQAEKDIGHSRVQDVGGGGGSGRSPGR